MQRVRSKKTANDPVTFSSSVAVYYSFVSSFSWRASNPAYFCRFWSASNFAGLAGPSWIGALGPLSSVPICAPDLFRTSRVPNEPVHARGFFLWFSVFRPVGEFWYKKYTLDFIDNNGPDSNTRPFFLRRFYFSMTRFSKTSFPVKNIPREHHSPKILRLENLKTRWSHTTPVWWN